MLINLLFKSTIMYMYVYHFYSPKVPRPVAETRNFIEDKFRFGEDGR